MFCLILSIKTTTIIKAGNILALCLIAVPEFSVPKAKPNATVKNRIKNILGNILKKLLLITFLLLMILYSKKCYFQQLLSDQIETFIEKDKEKVELNNRSQDEETVILYGRNKNKSQTINSDNINYEIQRLDEFGFELINPEPKIGSNNMLISFVNPKSVGGVLTEICQH